MAEQFLETALRDFEVTANSFAIRINKSASIRKEYVRQIKDMSQSIRGAVESGALSTI